MSRRRRPVPTLQEAVQVQPQAGPTGGRGDTGAPLDLPIYDFAPISNTITQALADKQRKDTLAKIQAGERWAVENPELAADIEKDLAEIADSKERAKVAKDTFAMLQRGGHVVAPGDPWWQVGYSRIAGRQLAADYRNRVMGRMREVSTVRDPQTGQLTAPPDLDQILSEEWKHVQNAPAVQNFYGGQEALGLKAQADEEFRAKAAMQRAKAQEADHHQMRLTEIGGMFDRILGENPVVTSETLQPITEYLTNEVRGYNVLNPRELTMEALELSIQRLASTDPDEAVRAVHAAQDLVVGGVRMGDDRGEVGLHLQTLTQRVREQARNATLQEIQLTDAKRKQAVQKGESIYVELLTKAKREGQSVTEVARRLGDEFLGADESSGKFGGLAPFVVDAMNDYARQLDAARASDGQVIDQFNILMADGQLEAAEALVRSAMGSGALTGEDYAASLKALNQRSSVSEFVEQSGLYQATRGRYGATKPTGFQPEVQQSLDDATIDLERRMERDFVEFVRTTEGKPNREDLHRKWLSERESADLAEIRKLGADTRSKGDLTVKSIRERLVRYQDSRELIDQAEKGGAVTVLEAQGMREANDKAIASRERFFESPAYKAAQAEIDQQFQRQAGGELPSASLIATQSAAHETLRDRFTVALDGILNDPSATPATYDARARSAVKETLTELGDQLFPSGRRAIEKALKAGATAEEAEAAPQKLEADLLRSGDWEAIFADPRRRESFSALSPLIVRDPAVPEDLYTVAAQWMSGLDPIFGRQVNRAQVDHVVARTLDNLVRDPAMDEKARQAAVGNVLSLVGVSPFDVLRERAVIEPSDIEQSEARRELAARNAWRVAGVPLLVPARGEDDQTLRNITEGQRTELDMTGYQWAPYTTPFFRSRAALNAFQHDPAYPDLLVRLGLDPEDEDQVGQWIDAQLAAIARVNP